VLQGALFLLDQFELLRLQILKKWLEQGLAYQLADGGDQLDG